MLPFVKPPRRVNLSDYVVGYDLIPIFASCDCKLLFSYIVQKMYKVYQIQFERYSDQLIQKNAES